MVNIMEFKNTEIGKIPKDWEDGNTFIGVIKRFLRKEKIILKENLNERTISHKLAEHLQKKFSDYDVDCEYNRMQNLILNRGYITKKLNLQIDKIDSDDVFAVTVYPDIIIHKRGDNNKNLLVIELKKRDNNQNKSHDFKKLKAYTKKLNYHYGIFIEFDGDKITELKFFRDGNIINEI